MYVVVVVLLIAGDQVPDIPLFDVVGNAGIVAPEQYGPTWVNVGVIFGLIATDIVFVVAQVGDAVDVGVNVYVVDVVLLIAGDQVPVILLFEVVGKAGIDAPEQ